MGQERPMEVAIIGGGIIGCAAAAFAAEAGARVTLFERSEIGAGAQIEVGAAAIPAVENGRAVGVILEGVRPRAADVVLVAAGPWSPFLLDPSGRWQPIVATWGATAQLDLASPPRHVVEEARVESVNQPSDGQLSARPPAPEDTPSLFTLAAAGSVVTIGSTVLAFEPDPRAMAPLLIERGKRFMPTLAGARIVATRACARPQSLDGRPLVGERSEEHTSELQSPDHLVCRLL